MAQAGIGDSVVRAAALVAVPWANGGGVTRVIVDRPQFRLSLATIADAGPFSLLAGVERQIALVSGQVALQPCAVVIAATSPPFKFSGGDAIHATPLGGPALALNLMVRDAAPRLRLERCDGGMVADAVAIFACETLTVNGLALEPHDTLFADGPVRVVGRALVVR